MTYYLSDEVSVQLGNGDGTFQKPATFLKLPHYVDSISLSDVNGDAHVDLLAQGRAGLSLLFNKGDGTFEDPLEMDARVFKELEELVCCYERFVGMAVGDVNGDLLQDVIATYVYWADDSFQVLLNGISVFLGNGDGTFQEQGPFVFDGGDRDILSLGDVNGDGHLDIVAGAEESNSVSVLLGNGEGAFQLQHTFAVGQGGSRLQSITLADLNEDGRLDLLAGGYWSFDGNGYVISGDAVVLLGYGDGTFQEPDSIAVDFFPIGVSTGDLDGDGRLDVVLTGRNQFAVLFNASPTPTTSPSLSVTTGTATVTAWLDAVSSQDVTIQLTFGGTATLNTDYTASATSITIPAGSMSGSMTLTVVPDAIDELAETIVIDLGTITNGISTGAQTVTTTIMFDDFPEVRVDADQADRLEGSLGQTAFTFVVKRVGLLNSTSSVDWVVSGVGTHAAHADDFGGQFPSGTVNFAVGESEKVIHVQVTGDTIIEPDEQFQLTLVNPVNLQLGLTTASGTIRNDDLSLSIAPLQATQREGNKGETAFTFSIVRDGFRNTPVEVSYVVTGLGDNAAGPTDFADGSYPTGKVDFAANETEKVITIRVAADQLIESDEDFRVTLTNPTVGYLAVSAADGQIINDDWPVLYMDDGDPSFEQTGSWTRYTIYGGYASVDRVADMRETGPNSNARAHYRFQNLTPGTAYSLAATWQPYSSRSTQAPYTLSGIVGGPRTILVNQQVGPNDFTELDRLGRSHAFETLGTFMTDATGNVTITVSSAAAGGVITDAIKLTPIATAKLELRQATVRYPDGDTLHVGTVLQGGYLTKNFTVINVGIDDLLLQPVTTTGAVSVTEGNFASNQRVRPGESVTLPVRLDLNPVGARSGTLSIASNDPDSPIFSLTITATTIASLVIDDGDSTGYTTTGSWGHWAGFGGFAGSDRYDDVKEAAANSGATATYTFPGLVPGASYQVAASWTEHPNRTTQAPYRVTGIEGSPQTIFVNQRNAPTGTVELDRRGKSINFSPLGNYTVDATGTLVVTLSAATSGNTIADAIRVVPALAMEVRRGSTTIFADAPVSIGTRLRGDQIIETLTITNRGSDQLILQPATTSGQTWIAGTNFQAGQTLAPGDSVTLQVQLDATESGERSGVVKIASNNSLNPSFTIPISATVVEGIFIDDGDTGGYQQVGNWTTWVGYGGYAELNGVGDLRETPGGSGATATYRFNGLTPGSTYQLAATWEPFTNRTTQAPYRIEGSVGGNQTVFLNQQLAPQGLSYSDQRNTTIRFQSLGNFTVDAAGVLTVVLGAATSGNVIADAIRISLAPDSSPLRSASLIDAETKQSITLDSASNLLLGSFDDSSVLSVQTVFADQAMDGTAELATKPELDVTQLIAAQAELAMLERWHQTLAEFALRNATENSLETLVADSGEGFATAVVIEQAAGEASIGLNEWQQLDGDPVLHLVEPVAFTQHLESAGEAKSFLSNPWHPAFPPSVRLQSDPIARPLPRAIPFVPYALRAGQADPRPASRLEARRVEARAVEARRVGRDAFSPEPLQQPSADLFFATWDGTDWFAPPPPRRAARQA